MAYTVGLLIAQVEALVGDKEITYSSGRPEVKALLPEVLQVVYNQAVQDFPDFFVKSKNISSSTNWLKADDHGELIALECNDADCTAGGVAVVPRRKFQSYQNNAQRQGTNADPIAMETPTGYTVAPARAGVIWYQRILGESNVTNEDTDLDLLLPRAYRSMIRQTLVELFLVRSGRQPQVPQRTEIELKANTERFKRFREAIRAEVQSSLNEPTPVAIAPVLARS